MSKTLLKLWNKTEKPAAEQVQVPTQDQTLRLKVSSLHVHPEYSTVWFEVVDERRSVFDRSFSLNLTYEQAQAYRPGQILVFKLAGVEGVK